MRDRIQLLIERYKKLYAASPLLKQDMNAIEANLKIVLPYDFCKLVEVYCGGLMGVHSLYSFQKGNDDYNIIDQTLYCRANAGLPERYIVLNEQNDGLIIMETKPTPEEKTPVIYCSIEDAYNVAEGNPLKYNPTIFESFTDFFEYLIEQEEEERRLQGADL